MGTVNSRQLEVFCAVIETGTVTSAAALLKISQPAASNLIAALERNTGLVLFLRRKKRLVATAEARMLYTEAEKLFHGVSHVARIANEIKNLNSGQLTIAAMPSFGMAFLPKAITAFVAGRPGVRISLQVRDSTKVIDWVIAQQVDIGFSVLPADHPAVRSELLLRTQGMCVLPPGHRLARRREIAPADLRDEPFISLGWEDRSRHVIDTVFDTAGVERSLSIETHFSEVACSFVAAGAGVAIVDPITALEFNSRKAVLAKPFTGDVPFDVRVLWPAFRSPSLVLDAFVQFLRGYAAERGLG